MTFVELEQEVGNSHGSIHAILSYDLKVSRVSAMFLPRQLTTDQMECLMLVAGDQFEKSTQDPTFITRVVSGDESLVFAYAQETKIQAAEWHTLSSPGLKKSHLVKSKEKWCSLHFFDIDGLVHHEFVLRGQTVNGNLYVQVLQRLRVAIRRKRRVRGRKSGSCITMTHGATPHLLCSNSLPREHSAYHPTTVVSGSRSCSLLLKWASRGRVSQPWSTSNPLRWPNSGWF